MMDFRTKNAPDEDLSTSVAEMCITARGAACDMIAPGALLNRYIAARAMLPALLLQQDLQLFFAFANMFLFLGWVESDLAIAAPDLLAVGGRAIDALLGFLLDEFPSIDRMCLHALSALKTDSMSEEFEFVPPSTIGIG